MSANWSLRSFGKPYFSLSQHNLAGMDAVGLPVGITHLYVQFRVFKLPPMLASTDEIHALVSVHELFGARLIELGITPAGALSARITGGATVKSQDGILAPDNTWRSAYCYFRSGDTIMIGMEGTDIDGGIGGAVSLAPLAISRVRLFNGADGIARTDVAIRGVQIYGGGVPANECRYDFTERSGQSVAAVYDPTVYPLVTSFDVRAERMTPLGYTYAWGPPSDEELTESYRWTCDTEYEDVTPTPTAYEQMEVV